jgi:hypothetical protein
MNSIETSQQNHDDLYKNSSIITLKPAKDLCHYSCTMISYTNLLLLILIILLLYLIMK